MAIWTADVEGLEDLMKAVAKLPEEAMKELEDASAQAGNKILTRAKSIVPMKTGTLFKSLKLIKASKRRKNKYYIAARISFGKDAAHAVPLELGHNLVIFGHKTGKRVEAKPFLRPAADENKQYTIDTMTGALNSALEKFSK
jgi:HK97 gp10 family phage protein